MNTEDSLDLKEQWFIHANAVSISLETTREQLSLTCRAKYILGDDHDPKQTIDMTAYVRQFESSRAVQEINNLQLK